MNAWNYYDALTFPAHQNKIQTIFILRPVHAF